MSVLSIRILCSIAGVLATDLPCLQTRIPLAHSNHNISLQINSLTYTRPQAPIVHELCLGGPSFLLHSVQLVVVEVVVLLLPLFGLCLLPYNSFSRLVLWFFLFPKKSGKVHEKLRNVRLNSTHRDPIVLLGHISIKKLIGNRSICRSSPFEYFAPLRVS